MMFTLLLLALGVSGVGVLVSRGSKTTGNAILMVGIVSLTAVAAVQIWHIVYPPGEKGDDRGSMAVASSLANCVIADLAGQSGTVILLFPPRSLIGEDAEQSYEDGFVMPMRHGHTGELHLKAQMLDAKPGKAGYDLAAFQQALEKNPDALAVVSYAGLPVGFETLFSTGQPKATRFYAYDPDGTTNWLGALKGGQVRAVVLPRPGTDPRARETAIGMPERIFDQFYLMVTQENVDQVADQLGKK